MTYHDLPSDLATAPLDDPALAGDVIDLILGPVARERGCFAIMICDERAVGLQPLVLSDIPADAGPGPLLALLDELLPRIRGAGGMVVAGRGRPGSVLLTDTDRAWHQVLIDACREHGVPLLGTFLATPAAIRPFPCDLRAAS